MLESIQVTFRWGADSMSVHHLEHPETFQVGENGHVPISMPLWDLVRSDAEGFRVQPPPGSFVNPPEATRVGDQPILVAFDGYEFEVSRLEPTSFAKLSWEPAAMASQGLSTFLHALVLFILLVFTTPVSLGEDPTPDQIQELQAALVQPEEPTPEPEKVKDPGKVQESGGYSGDTKHSETGKGKSPSGPLSQPSPAMSRTDALQEARSFGMVSLVGTLAGPPEGNGSPWGSTDLLGGGSGTDGMWGSDNGPLDLSGTGEYGKGGEDWKGKRSGPLTVCPPLGCRGFSDGVLPSAYHPHGVKPPRSGPVTSTGRLPPEVLQRVVRQSFGRFRACYETGLRANPSLRGRVAVAFVVGRDGSVGSAQNAGSDLPDPNVIACVVRGFASLSFPAPEDGIVKVTYPIVFSSN